MLAKRALSTMGEEVPRRLLPTVPNWKTPEVQKWLQQIGFVKYCPRFLVGVGGGGSMATRNPRRWWRGSPAHKQ